MDFVETDDAVALARALTRLLDSARHRLVDGQANELVHRVTDHIGCPLSEVPTVAASFGAWELVNLQRGLDAYLATHSPDADWFGVAGSGRGHQELMDMLSGANQYGGYQLGAVDYTTVATGPDSTTEAVTLGLVRTVSPTGRPIVLGVRGPQEHYASGCTLQALAADRRSATAAISEVERLMRAHDVFAGQLLSFDLHEHRGNEMVTFLPRPVLAAEDVVLPEGILRAIERHVVRAPDEVRRLTAHGQHLKRGLLLHGPPGTGKTHTVRYLLSRSTGATAVVLTGRALGMLGSAVTLARRLTPSIVVIEDVDLIAEDRSMSYGAQPMLFELLNRIDGVDADVDVTFVLTTNRVDALERALVDRPGRVDLAVEVPRPDGAARERLLRLYARDVELDLPDASMLVGATEGVTASFMRELVRRAVLDRLAVTPPGERVRLDGPGLQRALDGLGHERQRLTRALLGGTPASDPE